MFNFKGCGCEACGKPLTESADIVVCPECGAPYHRECYFEKGACVHEAEHKNGYEYKHGPVMKDDCSRDAQSSMSCPNCSVQNKTSNIFCQSCGQPLHAQSPKQTAPQANGEVMEEMSYLTGLPPIDKDDEIDGIAVRDWMEYTGTSGPYYIFQFKNMDASKRKTSICWSAVFFPYFYFCFRKMWLFGIAAGLFTLLTYVPSTMLLLSQAGIITLSVSTTLLSNLNLLASLASTLFNICCGMFAIYWYRISAGNAIKRKKASLPNKEAFSAWLQKSSGPSKIGLGVAIASLFMVSYAFVYIIGPDKIQNLMLLMTN